MGIKQAVFNKEAKNWKQFQKQIAAFFGECGYLSENEKSVELVRGKKAIDTKVQVRNEFDLLVLVECKYLNKPVNQEVVHAFRTVMQDSGANVGYIVSRKGFQSGAKDAIVKTSIKLRTIDELIEDFFKVWKINLAKKYSDLSNNLFPYWDPSGGKMPSDGKPISFELKKLVDLAYKPIISLPLSEYISEFDKSFPMDVPQIDDSLIVTGSIKILNYREYFDFVDANIEKAHRHYQILYREL